MVLPFQNLNADFRVAILFRRDHGRSNRCAAAHNRTSCRLFRIKLPISESRSRQGGEGFGCQSCAKRFHSNGWVTASTVIAQSDLDMRDNHVVWSHTYDRAVAQVAALRRDIQQSRSPMPSTCDTFAGLPQRRGADKSFGLRPLPQGPGSVPAAGSEAAEPELEAATRVAPKFAKAWSTLAAVRIVRVSHLFSERKQDDEFLMEKAARTAANRALALDPSNGEALAVLAHLTVSTHLLEINRLYQSALRSEPNNSQLLNWHGAFLWFVGRNREALDELTRAYDIDRVTPTVAENLAESLLWAGRYEDAKGIIDLPATTSCGPTSFSFARNTFCSGGIGED